jgi:hypothetical protein
MAEYYFVAERSVMRILCGCEESQAVTIELRKLGHEAYSCDIQECSGGHPEWHLQCDILDILDDGWDMMIAFPPCTYLSNAGIRWFNEDRYGDKARERKLLRKKAFNFVMKIANADIPKIAIENPVGYLNRNWRTHDQIIHPCYFGDPESKRTCLWLKGLPKLIPTNKVEANIYGYYKKAGKTKPIYFTAWQKRQKLRSKTFPGIAKAMAHQWTQPQRFEFVRYEQLSLFE